MTTMFSPATLYLDQKRDKDEEVLRYSKDITWEAKRIIFALHAVTRPQKDPKTPTLQQVQHRLETLKTSPKYFHGLAIAIATENNRHFHRISPALQEYAEAALFHHFLSTKTIATYEEMKEINENLSLPLIDYCLGLCDFTGELMKAAVATHNHEFLCQAFSLSRQVYASFSNLNSVSKEFRMKIGVMRASIMKIEDAVYRVVIKC